MSTNVDLNRASADEMQQVCDLGPVTARTIMRFRPFRHIDELEKVPGMSVLDVIAMKRLGCTIPARDPDR
ncbi:MAG: helix-hairpin-helix domain-containing protein [Gammaproteobacteria bacterium]|nr:helix-hairpin-helix domain-containing protein [Gammaproteobacteria bacterium]